jgi:hypothetical protein
MKFATLYLKPAYGVVNYLGNVGLLFVQQGFLAPKSLRDAYVLSRRVDPTVLRGIDELVGEGMSSALRGEGALPAARAATFGAQKWGAVVDRIPRRASFLYEARKAGYKSPEDLTRLVKDESLRGELAHVQQRANQNMVKFDDLTPVEQNVLRRLVYFYPWVRGATQYAGHMVRERPVASAFLGGLAQQGEQLQRQTLGDVPYYLQGAFGVGQNRLINPQSVAITQTPIELAEALASPVTGRTNLAGLADLGSPVTELALGAITRRNPLGVPYRGRGGPLGQAAWQQVQGLPLPLLYQRIQQARRGEGRDRIFPPEIAAALGLYGVGGLYPRPYSPPALRAGYQREVSGR